MANVRISEATHETLRKIAEDERQPMHRILDRAIEDYRLKRFWEATNEAYRALRDDPVAWSEVLKEREIWDATLADGFETE